MLKYYLKGSDGDGILWDIMGYRALYGLLWDIMGYYGILWDIMGYRALYGLLWLGAADKHTK
jgi:hypothetical protein